MINHPIWMCESSSAYLMYHKILKTATVISVAARNRESNRHCRIVGLFASQFISQSIQSMLYCQNGVMQQHARTGIAHDFPDSFAHGWLVAMMGNSDRWSWLHQKGNSAAG